MSTRRSDSKIRIFTEFIKIRIAELVALSTATGFVLARGGFGWDIVPAVVGIFLMAAGSGALNQIQERHLDAQMERTRHRPLPSGKLLPHHALAIALALLVAGGIILYTAFGWLAAFLGLLNAIWYNGVYTPLKRLTPFAVIPGALIGAVPPAIGWIAAGGSLLDRRLWALAFFFFIWQIPHFWLLLLNFGEDYERAGFPSLFRQFNKNQVARITFMWILATVFTTVFFPLYGFGAHQVTYFILFVAALWLVWNSRQLLAGALSDKIFWKAFMWINVYMMFIMAVLVIDRLWQ